MKGIIIKFKEKQDAFAEIYLVTAVCFFFMLVAVFVCIQPIRKLGVQLELQNIERGALYRCEATGWLTDETKEMILSEAKKHGLDPDKITITCNLNEMPGQYYQEFTTFGNEIELKISYEYTYTQTDLNGFTLNNSATKVETITVDESTTSKA